jgi:hypothetical protein
MSYVRQPLSWHRRLLIWLGFRSAPFPDDGGYVRHPSDPPEPLLTQSEYQIHDREFESPARGDGFNFSVKAHCIWQGTAAGLDSERLKMEMAKRRRDFDSELQSDVRAITRMHAPGDCAGVEQRINGELSYSWPIDGVGEITCTVRPLVGPDVAIRDVQRRAGLRGIQVAHDCEATHQRIDQLREDAALWRGLLEGWRGDQTTTDAIMLTLRPEDLETIVGRPSVTIDTERQHLVAEVSRWLERVRDTGWEEALFGFDSALRRLTEHLGIPPPPRSGIEGGNGQQWEARKQGQPEGGQDLEPGGGAA